MCPPLAKTNARSLKAGLDRVNGSGRDFMFRCPKRNGRYDGSLVRREAGRGQARALCSVAAAALALLPTACRSEPSPTVQAPPNPTSAPSTTLPACVVSQGAVSSAPGKGGDD